MGLPVVTLLYQNTKLEVDKHLADRTLVNSRRLLTSLVNLIEFFSNGKFRNKFTIFYPAIFGISINFIQ